MDARTLASTLGVLACALVIVAVAAPYPFLDSGAVAAYYGAGAITPLASGLVAVVGAIVFAAAREGRSDPVLTAGAALTLGAFVAAVAVVWAVTVPRSVVTQLSTSTLVGYHRFVLAAVALVVPVAGGWYARAIGLA